MILHRQIVAHLLAAVLAVSTTCRGVDEQTPSDRLLSRIEVGDVKWGRDLEAARVTSKASGKPVMVLFQEVPGCAGCQRFGRDVLQHPLIVEAAEDEFVPVVIFNNHKGYDEKILRRYREPAWNYQVVRFLDAKGKDLIARKDRVWSRTSVAARMRDALRAGGRKVPRYIDALADEGTDAQRAQVALAMSCFWTGEQRLGGLDGVVETEAGWLDSREVTLVTYRKDRLDLGDLVARARRLGCARAAYVSGTHEKRTAQKAGVQHVGDLDQGYRKARASDQKRQVANWDLDRIDGLTDVQRTKINAWAPVDREKALAWLSPRQRAGLVASTTRL